MQGGTRGRGDRMDLARRDLADEATRWRSSRKPRLRAVADNLAFEENVSGDRQSDFESFAAEDDGLLPHLVGYARDRVQGAHADHLPITFSASNEPALLTKIEPNQRVARLLRVDRALSAIVPRDEVPSAFARLAATLGPSGPDEASAAPLIRQLNQ